MRGHKTCLKSLTEQRSDLRGLGLWMTGQARPVHLERPGSYPGRSLTRELSGQYPELFQESKAPPTAIQTEYPPTHLKTDGGSLILNIHWNATVQADVKKS